MNHEAALQTICKSLTPARVFAPRKGTALSTKDWLLLRADHAFARDAVFESIDLERDFRSERIDQMGLFEVSSKANNRHEYLLKPDLPPIAIASSSNAFFSLNSKSFLQMDYPPQL
ncbi:MAG: ethanolamine ammonia-lyase light chain EutC [Planctomycetota bacterium]|nr:ethanolamine ammonia-lyase light chain EutC [Planctomycetota bacterium]